jgi:sarcosine oxidase subunit alpha
VKNQPHRLAVDPGHAFAGTAIDRSRPLRFRLNGHVIEGFEGDTVLSATMAAGFEAVGELSGHPLGLTERFAPPVVPVSLYRDRQQALPMARLPAVGGIDLRTIPGGWHGNDVRAIASRLSRGTSRSLKLRLAAGRSLMAPWIDIPARETVATDVIVIGGGVAGMTAALAAARTGSRVVLLERRTHLGGNALLFGKTEHEETPDHAIARLTREIAAQEAITLHLCADAFALDGQRVRTHAISVRDGLAQGEVLAFEAPRIVLATGALERLPLFAGNRLPGITGTAEAFHLAQAFGLWSGKTAVFATVSNPAYRVAMLAADAGIGVRRILDPRPRPQSRFLEFCKAYGITMAGGVIPVGASLSRRGAGLTLANALSIEDYVRMEEPLNAERIIVCGGWQPDLSLWHMGGGNSAWQVERSRLNATQGPAHLALAGAAAGHMSTRACLESGRDAIDRLFSRQRRPVEETVIDPIYETPDAPTPIAHQSEIAEAPCYLDDGTSLTVRPQRTAPDLWARLRLRPHDEAWRLAEQPRALGICDVAAGVQLGAIPVASAGLVARERAAGSVDLVDSARQANDVEEAPADAPLVPAYLNGRFGANAVVWQIAALEQRRLETGSLIFVNSDQSDPRYAMGVVLRPLDASGSALALIGKIGASPGEGATLRDQNRPVPVRLVRPHVAEAPADAILLGSA